MDWYSGKFRFFMFASQIDIVMTHYIDPAYLSINLCRNIFLHHVNEMHARVFDGKVAAKGRIKLSV